MGTRIREVAKELVFEYINEHEVYHKYLNGFSINRCSLTAYSLRIEVYIEFKQVGRGLKPNYARFDVVLDSNVEESVVFVWECHKNKGE